MLATTQAQFPDSRLNLVSGIEVHNNFVRFSWAAGGTSKAPRYLDGTDFAYTGLLVHIEFVRIASCPAYS